MPVTFTTRRMSINAADAPKLNADTRQQENDTFLKCWAVHHDRSAQRNDAALKRN